MTGRVYRLDQLLAYDRINELVNEGVSANSIIRYLRKVFPRECGGLNPSQVSLYKHKVVPVPKKYSTIISELKKEEIIKFLNKEEGE